MKKKIEMTVIGTVSHQKGYAVQLDKEFRAGLTGLAEFSHAVIRNRQLNRTYYGA